MLERLHVGNPKGRAQKGEVFKPALSNQPSGPRQGDSKVALVKQGVRGALRSKNLRSLLEAANTPEVLALLAEMPLERLQNMAEGALCSDETAYHLEQQLELPSGWLDRMNTAVPESYLNLLANPTRQTDDDTSPSAGAHIPMAAATPSPDSKPASPQAPVAEAPSPAKTSESVPALTPAPAPEPAELPRGRKIAALAARAASPNQETHSPTPSLAATGHSQGPATPEAPAMPKQPAPDAATAASANAAPVASPVAADPRQQSLLPETPSSLPLDQGLASASASLPTHIDNKPAMTPTELHLANLNVLLSGKGAKSALARLLNLSPASVTGMLNGVKPLNDETRLNVTQAVQLPGDWFEKARTAQDLPAETLKLLSPLARGAAAPAAVPRVRATGKPPVAEPSAGPAVGQGAAPAAPTPDTKPASNAPLAEERPTSWPPAGTKVSRLRGLTTDGASASHGETGGAAATGGTAAQAPAQHVASAAAPAPAKAQSTPSSGAHAQVQPKGVPEHQRGDTYPGMSAVLSESGLPPIAEALIKTLALKASSGALSEDKAFELLGSIRAL